MIIKEEIGIKMCGILGVVVQSKGRTLGVVKKLYKIYKNQQSRGQDGTGVSIYRNGKLYRVRDIEPEVLFSVMYYKFWSKLRNGDLVMVHHRIPTSGGGGDCLKANHPFSNEDGTLHLVHNGSIGNVDFLYNKLLGYGHKFESNISEKKGYYNITDSEILVHLLEGYEDMRENVKFLSNKIIGNLAIAFIRQGDDGIWLYRDGFNPISIFKDEVNNLFFASEYPERQGFIKVRDVDEFALFKISKNGVKRFRKVKNNKRYENCKTRNSGMDNWYGFDEKGEWIGEENTKW